MMKHMNTQNKTVSPGQQYNSEIARQEQLSKLHHLASGGIPSPTSDNATNSNSPLAGFPSSSNSSFTPSPDPFLPNKNLGQLYNNMQQQQQQQQSPIPNQTPMQTQDPFSQTPPPVSSSIGQDYLMRRPQQFHDGSYQMRPNLQFPQQMMNQTANPMPSQLKSAHLLYQLQQLQQQISQVRELPSPARDQPLQQLQQRFCTLYHMYLMNQQQQKWYQTSSFSPYKLMGDNRVVAGYHAGVITSKHPDLIRPAMETLIKLHEEGKIKPEIHHMFSLEEIRSAMQCMHDRKNVGKVLLSPLKAPPAPEPKEEPKAKEPEKKEEEKADEKVEDKPTEDATNEKKDEAESETKDETAGEGEDKPPEDA